VTHDEGLIAALRDAHDVRVRIPGPAEVQRIAGTRRRRRHVAWTAASVVVAGALLTAGLVARAGDDGTSTGTVDVIDDPTPSTPAPSTTTAPAPSTEGGASGVTVSPMSENVVGVVEVDGRYMALRGDGASRWLSVSDDAVDWDARSVEGLGLGGATSLTVAPGNRLVLTGEGRARTWVGTSTDGGATWSSVDLPLPESDPDTYWQRGTALTGVVPVEGGALAVGTTYEGPDLRHLATDQLGEDPGELHITGFDGPLVTVQPENSDETFVVDVTPAGPRAVELFTGTQHAPENGFLAVRGPATPLVWRTVDWQHWTRTTPLPAGRIRDAVDGPAGVLVIFETPRTGTASAYRSIDGQAWEEAAAPPVDEWSFLAADADRYWAFDGTTLASSRDGVTWQLHPLPIAPVMNLGSLSLDAGPAGVVLAFSEYQTGPDGTHSSTVTVLSSTDGETWDVERLDAQSVQAALVTDEELLLVTFE
jgi:hypothetical protein